MRTAKTDLDDVLKDRLTNLKADRGRARCPRSDEIPAGSGDPHQSGLDRKLRVHNARKPDDGIDAVRKAYLRSLIDVIEVDDA